jgi:hypothetical protein
MGQQVSDRNHYAQDTNTKIYTTTKIVINNRCNFKLLFLIGISTTVPIMNHY